MSTPRAGTVTSRQIVAEELRSRILDLTLPPGSPVPEKEVSAELGVSRTPVREALILLAQEGLVDVFPQVGTFVTRIDPAAVAQAQFVREALETASIRDLGPRPDRAKMGRLRELLDDQEKAVATNDVDRFFTLDQELHRSLMALAGHESAWSVVAAAKGHLDRARRASLPLPDTLDRLLTQHRAVVDEIDEGANDRAEEALRMHLREVFRDIDEIRSRTPHFFTDGRGRPRRRMELA